ncbi:MAG: diguanylate cyclase [Sphingomonas sp.]
MVVTAVSPVLVRAVALGVAYFVAASAMMLFSRLGGGLAILWLASGLLTAQLSLAPRREWRVYIIACGMAIATASALFGLGPLRAIPMASINLLEATIVAMAMRRYSRGAKSLESIYGILLFMVATTVATTLSATLGALVAITVPHIAFWPAWLAWFSGHALGTITVAPIAILSLSGEYGRWWRSADNRLKREAALLLALMIIVCLAVFGVGRQPLLFLPMLPLMIATFRLDRVGTATGIIVIGLIGGAYTAIGYGPVAIVSDLPLARAIFFQLFLAATILTALPVSAELQQRRNILMRLIDSEARYKLITENSTDIVLSLDTRGLIRYASPSVREILGVDPNSLIGLRPNDIGGGPDQHAVKAAYQGVFDNDAAISVIEYGAALADGDHRWFEARTRGLIGDDGQPSGWVSTIRDISQRKSLELQLAHAAATDPLTGLANRRAFDILLDRRIERGFANTSSDCVAVFDIDFFKRVNDAHGHGVGDLVLEAFADEARRAIRASDYVARLGGEEFGIIFSGTDLAQAALICERLRRTIAARVTKAPDGSTVSVTVSAGVALLGPSMSRNQVMRAADDALYRAKAAGRDRLALAA